MARMSQKRVVAKVEAQSFRGLDCEGERGDPRVARRMSNFRVMPDGSLAKRDGFRTWHRFSGQVRGSWTGHLRGEDVLLVVAGNKLYRVVEGSSGQAVCTELVTLTTSTGQAVFFFMDGCVFLMDGAGCFSYDGVTAGYANCYAPLYGENWDPFVGGSVHEPINVFSKMIRIHYYSDADVSSLYVGKRVEAVDRLLVDGFRLSPSQYHLSEDRMTINMDVTYVTGHYFILFLRLSDIAMQEYSAITSCTGVTIYGGEFDDTVFLYHGSSPADIYYSQRVSGAALNTCRSVWPSQMSLYFTLSNKLTVDMGNCEVTGLCRYYDRLLIFKRDSTSMADLREGVPEAVYPALPGNSLVGCLSPESMCYFGDDPITVCGTGVYRWQRQKNTEQKEACQAVCVSRKVADMWEGGQGAAMACVSWRERGEIWFYRPGDALGQVLVYEPERDIWYGLTGITATGMFLFRGGMFFYQGTGIYRFSATAYKDEVDQVERPIVAEYQVPALDMGLIGHEKRLKRCYLKCAGGGTWTIHFETDRGVETVFEQECTGTGMADVGGRMTGGRFTYGDLTVEAEGGAGQRLYGLTLVCGH